jgi:hypothetical protein
MEKEASQGHSSQLQKYLPTLHKCRDAALSRFSEQLDQMFEHVEPALLDFIDKAETNQSQFQFIDAISVVNSRKAMVKQRFQEEISRGFTEFSRGQAISYPVPLLDSQREKTGSLELVGEDELNQRLSLQNMVERAQNSSFQQLYALKQRLSLIRGGQKMEQPDTPGGPLHCTSAFQTAAGEFGFETNILLITYALFDKFVMRQLKEVYEAFNQALIDEGVFPNLQLEIPRSEASVAGDNDNEPAAAAEADSETAGKTDADGMDLTLGEELFNSIRNLMASRRRGDPRYAHHPDYDQSPGAGSGRQTMVDTPTLVSAIGDLQPDHSASFLPQPDKAGNLPASVEVDMQMLEQIRQRLIQEREKLFRGVDPSEIPSADLDTIELVGMLFEHVLNEKDLPNIAKALISHLHTPYLKVAILDHHFLIDSKHIARRLLNLMVDAGRMWIEEQDLRRGIYYPMQEHVNRILSEFKDEVSLFDEIFETLSKQLEDLEQKARVVENRAREATRGKERLESVRTQAHRFIQERIGDKRFHPIIENFLNHAWLDKMILMLLRDPHVETTPEWQQVLRVIDDLLWAYRSRNDLRMRTALQERLPDLKQRIEEGLAAMGNFHQPAPQTLFDLFSNLPETAQAAGSEPNISIPEQRQKRKSATQKPATPPLSDQEKTMVETLKKARFGTWFELEDDTGKTHCLKLSWFSPVTAKYMFVDKSGIKALVTPIDVLARQMCKGKGRIIRYPSAPFVDRALKTVFRMLRMSNT